MNRIPHRNHNSLNTFVAQKHRVHLFPEIQQRIRLSGISHDTLNNALPADGVVIRDVVNHTATLLRPIHTSGMMKAPSNTSTIGCTSHEK